MNPTIILLNTLEYCLNKLRPIIYKIIKNELNIPNASVKIPLTKCAEAITLIQ